MSYGFFSTNTNNEIIISENTVNHHYVGKATYTGSSSAQSQIKGYSGSYSRLDGINYLNYYIDVPLGDPLVFIHPKEDIFDIPERKYAIFKKYPVFSGGLTRIHIQVIMTGVIEDRHKYSGSILPEYVPDLHCFDEPAFAPLSDNLPHGLQVYKEDGTIGFDSRKRPLAIIGGGEHEPPEDPTNGSGLPGYTDGHPWKYKTNDHDFRSTLRKNSVAVDVGNRDFKNIMFATSTIAQACWVREMHGYKNSRGWFSSQKHWSWASWWVMYRNCCGLREDSTGLYFDSGWGPVKSGFYFSIRFQDGGLFGGGGGSSTTGTPPFQQQTLNLRPSMFLLADATTYA
jgi:hypothetical protein